MRCLIALLVLLPLAARAQDAINPFNTQQAVTIELHNTDVYYDPYEPPDSTDTRTYLCNESVKFRDPNNVDPGYSNYRPMTHGKELHDWAPDSTPLGWGAAWQRFFTAKRDASGNPHDIIAGGDTGERVFISKNEDVDFRASGRIILKSGFHAMPGCFFHAYTEPRWKDTVFSDDFMDSVLDRSKWLVLPSVHNNDYEFWGMCSSDSNVSIVSDPDAHDGKALDIAIRLDTDGCSCRDYSGSRTDTCSGGVPKLDTIYSHPFSSANLSMCPFPFASRDNPLGSPAWANAPYGKYEFREKVPHLPHHINDWGYSQCEVDLGEAWNSDLSQLHPDIGLSFHYGPFKGVFGNKSLTDTTKVFRSGEPHWCNSNWPTQLIIDRVPYDIAFTTTPTDTFLDIAGETQAHGGFPYALRNQTDSITFYYARLSNNKADTVTWTVTKDGTGAWRLFWAPYHIQNGETMRFSSDYQPTSLTLKDPFGTKHTVSCRWDQASGKIWLDSAFSDSASNTEPYAFTVNEGVYPMPSIPTNDTSTTGGYEYHTFTVEWLPNEMRYLYDSSVVFRVPDRLVPPSSKYYNWGANIPRALIPFHPGETDIDNDSLTAAYLNAHPTNPGCWDVEFPPGSRHWYHAGHERLDYVKVWDLPADITAPAYPY